MKRMHQQDVSMKAPSRRVWQRSLAMLGMILLGFSVVVGRLAVVQLKQHDLWQNLAEEQQLADSVISDKRGAIVDRNGVVLARSTEVATVIMMPGEIPSDGAREQICRDLPTLLGIGAEKLEYETVLAAMERGDLYASTGAEIHDITVSDGILTVDCSPAHCIKITSHCRRGGGHFTPMEGETTISHCELDLNQWLKIWQEDGQENAFVRVEIIGPENKRAYSRPYRLEELI